MLMIPLRLDSIVIMKISTEKVMLLNIFGFNRDGSSFVDIAIAIGIVRGIPMAMAMATKLETGTISNRNCTLVFRELLSLGYQS